MSFRKSPRVGRWGSLRVDRTQIISLHNQARTQQHRPECRRTIFLERLTKRQRMLFVVSLRGIFQQVGVFAKDLLDRVRADGGDGGIGVVRGELGDVLHGWDV